MDLVGAAHDDVADAGQDEGVDAAGNAVFHDDISLMAVDATEEDGLGVLKCFVQVAKAFFGGEGADDFEMDVHAVALDEGVHLTPFAEYDDGLLRWEFSEVPVVREDAPADDEDELDEKSEPKRDGIHEVPVDEDCDDVHHGVYEKDGKRLAVDEIGDTADGNPVAMVEVRDEVVKDRKECHHDLVAQIIKRSRYLVSVVGVPADSICHCQ